MRQQHDALAPAVGILIALLISIGLWSLLVYVYYLVA